MELTSVETGVVKENLSPVQKRKHAAIGTFIYTFSLCLILILFLRGLDYYLTPLAERAHHPGYRELRPAGSLGLMYGIAGASLLVIMLIYTMRKRTRLLGRWPRLSSYLNLHIYLGIMGPLFVTLHTSFKIEGLVAVGYWSMIAVALSGFFGRFLYQQIPRNIYDQELSLKQIEESIQQTTLEMKERGTLFEDAHKLLVLRLDKIYAKGNRGTIRSIIRLMLLNLVEPITRRRFRKKVRRIIPITGTQYRELFDIACRQSVLRMQVLILSDVQRLFHHWHVIHKPFAIIMYIIMGVHIGVAVWTGYGWIN